MGRSAKFISHAAAGRVIRPDFQGEMAGTEAFFAEFQQMLANFTVWPGATLFSEIQPSPILTLALSNKYRLNTALPIGLFQKFSAVVSMR